MKNGWYILNYHDISWEENPFIKGIGGSFPPDVFREHLEALSQHGRLVSVQEGFELYRTGKIDEPLFSFWFDDGFTGVRKYAMPIMESYSVQGAISINSRFTLRAEMFWRSKLSYLSQTDGLRFLRSKLRIFGYKTHMSVKSFVMDHFSMEIIDAIDSVYNDLTKENFRNDAFRLFDTMEGIKVLHQNGWEISNHSSAHYPVSEESHIHHFKEEFDECEKALHAHLGIHADFWVVPFDRKSLNKEELLKVFHSADDQDRHLVLVGDKFNQNYNAKEKIIYRIDPPYLNGKDMIRYLKSIELHTH